jgi:hypothetical protein
VRVAVSDDIERLMGVPIPPHFTDGRGNVRRARVDRAPRRWRAMFRESFKRGLVCSLTEADYAKLVAVGVCYYCGCGICDDSTALDRRDSSVGYEPGNVVPACAGCNKAKQSHAYETWKRIADAFVAAHGLGTMWPPEPKRGDPKRRALMDDAKAAIGIVRGIRALALWAASLERKRGLARRAWDSMIVRHRDEVCPRWADKVHGRRAFIEDVGDRPSNRHELARVDQDRPYEPGNVRWVTPAEGRRLRNGSLTAEKVDAAMKLASEGLAVKDIAAKIGHSAGTVSGILRGHVARDITGLSVNNGPRRTLPGDARLDPHEMRRPGWAAATRARIRALGLQHKDVAARAGCGSALLSNQLAERGAGSSWIPAIDAALDALEYECSSVAA